MEFAQARYYNSTHGRFTSVDPLTASATIKNPQTFNRYSYVLNSPYKFTDPLGLLSVTTSACGQWCSNSYQGEGRYIGSNGNFSTEQHAEGPAPPPAPNNQVVDVRQDKIINAEVEKIKKEAKPLKPGEVSEVAEVVQITGETTLLNNATIIDSEGNTVTARDSQGNVVSTFTGYMQPVAYVLLDQGGNIMTAPNDMFFVETVTPDSADAKTLNAAGRLITANGIERGQTNSGVFYDIQMRNPGNVNYNIDTTQVLEFRIYYGPKVTDYYIPITLTNKINQNDSKKTITVKLQ